MMIPRLPAFCRDSCCVAVSWLFIPKGTAERRLRQNFNVLLTYAVQLSFLPNTAHLISSFPSIWFKYVINKSRNFTNNFVQFWKYLELCCLFVSFLSLSSSPSSSSSAFLLFLGSGSCPSRQQHSLGHTKLFPCIRWSLLRKTLSSLDKHCQHARSEYEAKLNVVCLWVNRKQNSCRKECMLKLEPYQRLTIKGRNSHSLHPAL